MRNPLARPEHTATIAEPLNMPPVPYVRQGWGFDVAMLALMPFVQLGVSYYMSVAMLLAILMLVRLRTQLLVGLRMRFWILLLVPLMYVPLILYSSDNFTDDVIRNGREAMVFFLMMVLFAGVAIRPISFAARPVLNAITILTLLVAILVGLQFVTLRGGVYMGLPREFYAQGMGTIPGALNLYYTRLRPAGTFSEPSYLGFVLLSFLLVAMAMYQRYRRGVALIVLTLIAGGLSQSASFVLFGIPLVLFGVLRSARGGFKTWMIVMIPVVAGMVYVIGDAMGLFTRLQGGTSVSGDFSIFVRIFGPLSALPDFLSNYPFGLPESTLNDALLKYASPLGIEPDQYRMNSLMNLFFQFGVFGIPIAILLLWRNDLLLFWFMLGTLLFNGAFLAVDKLAIVCLTVAWYQAIRRARPETDLR